jgi:hypothetical protein
MRFGSQDCDSLLLSVIYSAESISNQCWLLVLSNSNQKTRQSYKEKRIEMDFMW